MPMPIYKHGITLEWQAGVGQLLTTFSHSTLMQLDIDYTIMASHGASMTEPDHAVHMTPKQQNMNNEICTHI
jgi:hypothetical protein